MSAPCPYPFPMAIDSTMRGSFVRCPLAFYYEYILKRRLKGTKIHLHAGGTFAAGIERVRIAFHLEGLSEARSIYEGIVAAVAHWGDANEEEGHVKSLNRVCGAILDYFCEYPLAADFLKPLKIGGRLFTEISFSFPLEGTKHPVTGDPILYAGRIDMAGEYEGGIFVNDEKTAKQLGETFTRKWALRGQFFGYIRGVRGLGIPAAGVLVRGTAFYAKAYGHSQSTVSVPDWQEEKYYQQAIRDVNRMIACWESNIWDQNFDDSCFGYSPCAYSGLCEKMDPEPWLEMDYEIHDWNPLRIRKGEEVVI